MNWERRQVLRSGVAAAAVLAAGGPAPARAAPARPSLIREENAKKGTTDWLLSHTRTDPEARYRCPWIEGYCSRNSVRAGETLDVMVSTNPASPFRLSVYRMGFYGGRGGRLMGDYGPFPGKVQPDPPAGEQRLRECRWEPSAKIAVPEDWPSGVYLGKLTAERESLQSYVIFIVRDDRACDFLFQCSDTTWAAYNRWPRYDSLYDDGSTPPRLLWHPDAAVSFDRPYAKYCQIFDAPLSQGSGEFLLWEFPLAYWMEEQGYDVSYISNIDTHTDGKGLLRAKAFLSVGHDEYWTIEMYRNVQAAIASGVNAAFLCGNSCYGLIPLLPGSSGAPHRVFTRLGRFQPGEVPPEQDRYRGRWKQHGPDAALLMGARTTHPANGGADWTCVRAKHWLFEGTGMKNGDAVRGLVGWEHHGEPAEIPGLEVLARGPVFSRDRPQGVDYTATIYPGPAKNRVFNAATIWWSDGLSAPPGYLHPYAHGSTPPGPDPRVQRMTKNLFERFLR